MKILLRLNRTSLEDLIQTIRKCLALNDYNCCMFVFATAGKEVLCVYCIV